MPALLPAYYQLRHRSGDADGDRARDFTIFRPNGTWSNPEGSAWDAWWWTRFSSGDNSTWATSTWQGIPWGTVGDIPVPGDYDGDGRMDPAIYRPSDGTWWVRFSSGDNSSWATSTWQGWQIGLFDADDVALPEDYDGDGRTDLAVHHRFFDATGSRGTLKIWSSSTGYSSRTIDALAISGTPIRRFAADFDGDGRSDFGTCYNRGRVWLITPSNPIYRYTANYFWAWVGFANPICVVADFDGDGRADLGVYAPDTGQWAWMESSTDYRTIGGGWYWGGLSGAVPVPGDYDGDGRADLAIYWPSDGR